jgi:hypothetical protein
MDMEIDVIELKTRHNWAFVDNRNTVGADTEASEPHYFAIDLVVVVVAVVMVAAIEVKAYYNPSIAVEEQNHDLMSTVVVVSQCLNCTGPEMMLDKAMSSHR